MYNIALNISNKNVLIFGAGRIAERKIKTIIDENCKITVISVNATEYIKALATNGKIRLMLRNGSINDVSKKYFIIFAATSNKELNNEICKTADSMNILCDNVSNHNTSNFISPASMKISGISISINTGGVNPSLAKILKEELYNDIMDGKNEFVKHIKYLLDN